MSKKDMFGDELSKHNDNDFASMFENNSDTVGGQLFVGQKFIGEILSMGKAESFVSTVVGFTCFTGDFTFTQAYN